MQHFTCIGAGTNLDTVRCAMAKKPSAAKAADKSPDQLEKFDAAEPTAKGWYDRWRFHLPAEAQTEFERLL